jgi:hypothetical protein
MLTLNNLILTTIFCLWAVDETFVIIFLSYSNFWNPLLGFIIAHAIGILLTWWFLLELKASSKEIDEVIGKNLMRALLVIACIPLIGQAAIFIFGFSFKFAPTSPIAREDYEIVDSAALEKEAYNIQEMYYNLPTSEIIALIHGRMPFEDTMKTLSLLDKLGWTPHKTRLLQMILEYNKHPLAGIGAARILNEKKNKIFNQIGELEKLPEVPYVRLASLYYDIYDLGLVDAQVGIFYLNGACEHIDNALKADAYDFSAYNRGIRYYLDNQNIDKAEELLNQAMGIFKKEEHPPTFAEYQKEIQKFQTPAGNYLEQL